MKTGLTKSVSNKEKTRTNLNQLRQIHGQSGIKFGDRSTVRNTGEALLPLGENYLHEAEDWIRTATQIHHKNSVRWDLAIDYSVNEDWFRSKGDLPQASDRLTKAMSIFQE